MTDAIAAMSQLVKQYVACNNLRLRYSYYGSGSDLMARAWPLLDALKRAGLAIIEIKRVGRDYRLGDR